MSQNPASRRVFPVLVVLAALLLASLPAQARPSRPAGSGLQAVAVVENHLARLWSYVVQLWQPSSMTKEGVSIDPNGRNGSGVVLPTGGGDDEGTSIDPNGRG
jgi:hypothetical protein